MRKQDLARAAEVAVISIKFLYYKHDSLAAKVRLVCLFAHSVSLVGCMDADVDARRDVWC